MADTPPSQPTVCAACHADLAAVPFTVDKKGRGICKPCVAKLRAKREAKARQAAEAAPVDVMDVLLAGSAASTKVPCSECQSYIDPESVVCVHCGYNIRSGKHIKTRLIAAPKEKEAKAGKAKRKGPSINLSPQLIGCIVGLICAGPVFLGALDPELAVVGLGIAVLVHSAISLALWIYSLIDGHLMWTILMFLCGGIAHLLYALMICERPVLKSTFFGSLIGAIIAIVVFTAVGPELESVSP